MAVDQAVDRRHQVALHVVRERRRLTLFRAPVVTLTRRLPYTADIVHVAATYPFTTPAVLRRAERLGIPSVLDFHFEPHLESGLGKLAAKAYQRVGPPAYRLADAVVQLLAGQAGGGREQLVGDLPAGDARGRAVHGCAAEGAFEAARVLSDEAV